MSRGRKPQARKRRLKQKENHPNNLAEPESSASAFDPPPP
jgi:hypothetical protein